MEALNKHFDTLGPGTNLNALHLRQVFACEIVPQKRRWIDALVNSHRRALDEPLMCIFCDIRDMGKTTAHCHVHDRLCIVPDCDILVASTSCKDLSKLSSNRNKFEGPVLDRKESPGGSADSFRGLLTYMDSHSIEMLVYENSDNLDDCQDAASGQRSAPDAAPGQKTNSEIFTAEVTSRNMEGQSFVLNSSLFGVPQARKRFWSVFVNCGISRILDFRRRSVTEVFRTLRLLVQVCQRLTPSAASLLLEEGDPAVITELARRVTIAEKRKPEPFTWVNEHTRIYDSLLITADAPPPCAATSQSPWFKTLSRKQQSTLITHQTTMLCSALGSGKGGAALGQAHKKSNRGAAAAGGVDTGVGTRTILDFLKSTASSQGSTALGQTASLKFMVDLMPSPGKVSTSTQDSRNDNLILAPCILPSQLLRLHRDGSFQRLLLGQEAMLLQGWPIGLLTAHESLAVSNAFLQDFAGNATSPPVILAVLMALFYSVLWKSPDGARAEASDVDVNEALALFCRVTAPGH
jgi:site-specific DNA-cytosine methylase